jgi:hypothetical protein
MKHVSPCVALAHVPMCFTCTCPHVLQLNAAHGDMCCTCMQQMGTSVALGRGSTAFNGFLCHLTPEKPLKRQPIKVKQRFLVPVYCWKTVETTANYFESCSMLHLWRMHAHANKKYMHVYVFMRVYGGLFCNHGIVRNVCAAYVCMYVCMYVCIIYV